jgi:hypothetical protein
VDIDLAEAEEAVKKQNKEEVEQTKRESEERAAKEQMKHELVSQLALVVFFDPIQIVMRGFQPFLFGLNVVYYLCKV